MSYTEQITKELIEAYEDEPTRETVERLAETYGKSVKSIIGKLSREGVYRREVYRSKTGDLPVTKVELVADLAETLGLESWHLAGLEKAPKATLKKLTDEVERIAAGS
jgi:hypothetical protein